MALKVRCITPFFAQFAVHRHVKKPARPPGRSASDAGRGIIRKRQWGVKTTALKRETGSWIVTGSDEPTCYHGDI